VGTIFIFAVAIAAILLFVAVKRKWISPENLKLIGVIVGIVGGIATLALFVIPPAASSDPSAQEFTSQKVLAQGLAKQVWGVVMWFWELIETPVPLWLVLILTFIAILGCLFSQEWFRKLYLRRLQNTVKSKSIDNLNIPRAAHLAVKLRDGSVLVMGGNIGGALLKEAELYDPVQLLFTPTAPLGIGRSHNGVMLLNNGNVFVAGDKGKPKNGEVYDAESNTFSFTKTASLFPHNSWFAMTLLKDGRVLLSGTGTSGLAQKTEIYNPDDDTFIQSFDLLFQRQGHTATLLEEDGTVLIVGNSKWAELFNPQSGSTRSGCMCIARQFHTATLLQNGNVLIIGGRSVQGGSLPKEAELYDKRSGDFNQAGDLEFPRWGHTATLIPGGRVIVIGGFIEANGKDHFRTTTFIEQYDPHENVFRTIGRLRQARVFHSTTLLDNGSLLVVGGVKRYKDNLFDTRNILKSAEIVHCF
jgi:hypothetical protein